MKINKLAIAGADNKVNQLDLVNLSNQFPFIEWSILLSKNKEGQQRYPTEEYVKELSERNIPLSAHFCGWWAKQVLEESDFELIWKLPDSFKRIQLNYNFKNSSGYRLPALLRFAIRCPSKSIILQFNKSNADVLRTFAEEPLLPTNIHFLYDSSGGYGKEIERIAPTIGEQYTGYAGGMNPENIEKICQMISDDPETVDTWVDLESGARTNNEFDLSKVLDIANKVNKFIR